MKSISAFLISVLGLASVALSAPRVGEHDGFTRLVFDLPKSAPFSTAFQAGKFTVKLGTTLKTEQGQLSAAGVTGYRVAGSTVTLGLAPGHTRAKVSVLKADGKQPARLVIDVPSSPDSPVASKTTSSKRVLGQRTPAAVTRPASTRTLTRPKVVIDAGHGGIDPGMTSRWVMEKDVTLDVALRLRELLQARGVAVQLVRSSDRHLSSDKETDLYMRSNMAVTGEVAAYISIHVNAGGPGAQGIETYYFGKPLGGTNRSLAVLENGGGNLGQKLTQKASNMAESTMGDILAQAKLSFSQQLAQKVQYSLLSATGAVNRGVHTDAFYVIRNPKTAAILTEIGFGSHPTEGPKLAEASYRQKIASGIAQALFSFLNVK
ncbi:N-acetylmuramoyl-L-alanine amidase [Deinococcus cavernae]|uniref:N-acetylmuramoyl-L-alanine amidase n=1 Tax=Deinococcus cavernae TaxID=2320857 RepID=A0A418V6E7_9DEIO|nr:N-acetylmuramoyl-L-alanine amidase [Deinococcus cavernae]RJF71687.1 N-acetylmuramoyl-L-alanine amidase [Deinococcus cavernae]